MGALQSAWPQLRFTHIVMNGADDVRKYRKWLWASPEMRMITMGRPGDTESVVREALEAGIDLDEGTFIMGPELPDISSSAARAALCRGDDAAAAALLHPAVLAWCQRHGPWKRARGSNIE